VKKKKRLHRAKEERNFLHTMRRRKAEWTGHILHRNCLLQDVIEDKRKNRSDEKTRKNT